RAAVRTRRGARRGVLPADLAGRRGCGQGTVGADPADGARTIGSSAVTRDQAVLLAVCGLALVCVVLLVVLLRTRAGARRTAGELSALRQRLDDLERARGDHPAS